MPTFKINQDRHGLEIFFESKPDESIGTELKNNGFKWCSANMFWYAKGTPERLALVEYLCKNHKVEPSEKSSAAKIVA